MGLLDNAHSFAATLVRGPRPVSELHGPSPWTGVRQSTSGPEERPGT